MKYLIHTLAFLLLILVASCSDSPFTPPAEKNPPTGQKQLFGLVEVTISGIGTDQMTASAKSVTSRTAFNLTTPVNTGNSGDGTIQMQSISQGSFTTGSRSNGTGLRYLYATFKVRNAQSDSTAYDTPRENLTFVAADTDAPAFTPETYGVTAISELRFYDGTILTGAASEQFANNTIPTGAVYRGLGGTLFPQYPDVLQIFTEDDISAITVPDGVSLFPYGFVTHSPNVTPGSRTLPVSSAKYDGVVTFAFKIPLSAQSNQDPFEITALFLPVDDSQTRITQSLEEQTLEGRRRLINRITALNPTTVTILPGSIYQGPARLQCNPVRVAGMHNAPTSVLFPVPPVLQSITPNPYATDGSASNIPANSAFSAIYDNTVQAANSNTFVVHGAQSGHPFIGGSYNTTGATVTSPAGSYFPGELIEVTLTSGLGSCQPAVTRYRVETNPASPGSFVLNSTITAEADSRFIIAGDWDDDADLDLVVINSNSDTIGLFENDGSGVLTEKTTVSVGDYPQSVTAGDWDSDGDLDLAVANSGSGSNSVSLLENDGSGAFTIVSNVSVGIKPWAVTAGDWNGDGDLDLAVVNRADDNVSLLKNDGSGAFTEESTVSVGNRPQAVMAGDWNSDGDLDLAVANQNDVTISVLVNDGNGAFTVEATLEVGGYYPTSLTAGDWNGDGDLDLAIGYRLFNIVSLLKNNGSGAFTETTLTAGSEPRSIITGDWDGDFDLDLAVANYDGGTVGLLENDGDGGFTETTVGAGNVPQSITAGDWDGDGDLDLAVVNFIYKQNDTVSLLINNE